MLFFLLCSPIFVEVIFPQPIRFRLGLILFFSVREAHLKFCPEMLIFSAQVFFFSRFKMNVLNQTFRINVFIKLFHTSCHNKSKNSVKWRR